MLRDDDYFNGHIPWSAVIRMRSEAERNALVAGIIQRSVGSLLPESLRTDFSTAITAGATRMARQSLPVIPAEAGREWRLRQLEKMAEYDDICPPFYKPRPHPAWELDSRTLGPRPEPWRESGLAEVGAALVAAIRLVDGLDDGRDSDLTKEIKPTLESMLDKVSGMA
jgi:hypothetical protein